ncbi:MAG: OsmC family protein [Solirubrobacterales bacterium]
MPVRTADARWEGSLPEGNGNMRFGSGAFDGAFSFGSRFEEAEGTNPEELIGAAHAGCFSMAFSGALGKAGYEPESIETTARVHIEKGDAGFSITRSELTTTANVPGVDEAEFQEIANGAKEGCPVSRALTGVEISLEAALQS